MIAYAEAKSRESKKKKKHKKGYRSPSAGTSGLKNIKKARKSKKLKLAWRVNSKPQEHIPHYNTYEALSYHKLYNTTYIYLE